MRQCALCMFSRLIAQKASVICFINQPCNRVGEHLQYGLKIRFVLKLSINACNRVGEHLFTLWSEKRLCLLSGLF